MILKKYIIIFIDIALAIYLVLAVTAFNKPERLVSKCTKVDINITDESTYGFLNAKEIKAILEKKGLYPLEKDLESVSPRHIEEMLVRTPFVRTAQCCKTMDGHVLISVTQRSPLVRIKSINNDDYYLDENGGIMPNSKYTSDLIIVTGYVSRQFAQRYISVLANVIMQNDLWRNQIVQVNVQHDLGIELVPRVGDHIVFLGYLPVSQNQAQRQSEISEYVTQKLDRLEKFYIHGLDSVGWNKYERIDLQFSNQIICKRRPEFCNKMTLPVTPEVHEADHPAVEAAAASEHRDVATNEVVGQETKKTEASKPKKSETTKPETKKPETTKSEAKKPEAKKSETKKPEAKKSDIKKNETKKKP